MNFVSIFGPVATALAYEASLLMHRSVAIATNQVSRLLHVWNEKFGIHPSHAVIEMQAHTSFCRAACTLAWPTLWVTALMSRNRRHGPLFIVLNLFLNMLCLAGLPLCSGFGFMIGGLVRP